jgi:hypothetical protein
MVLIQPSMADAEILKDIVKPYVEKYRTENHRSSLLASNMLISFLKDSSCEKWIEYLDECRCREKGTGDYGEGRVETFLIKENYKYKGFVTLYPYMYKNTFWRCGNILFNIFEQYKRDYNFCDLMSVIEEKCAELSMSYMMFYAISSYAYQKKSLEAYGFKDVAITDRSGRDYNIYIKTVRE